MTNRLAIRMTRIALGYAAGKPSNRQHRPADDQPAIAPNAATSSTRKLLTLRRIVPEIIRRGAEISSKRPENRASCSAIGSLPKLADPLVLPCGHSICTDCCTKRLAADPVHRPPVKRRIRMGVKSLASSASSSSSLASSSATSSSAFPPSKSPACPECCAPARLTRTQYGNDMTVEGLLAEDFNLMVDILDDTYTEANLEQANGVLVLYSVTDAESLNHADRMISRIRAEHGIQTPIVLLGTKMDADRKRVVSECEGERLARRHRVHFKEVSARRNEGVNEAFDVLLTQIVRRQGMEIN
ncbi:unnamed protein product, partial [Mesorhabditis spiculigera]